MREARALNLSGGQPQRPPQREIFDLYFKLKIYRDLNGYNWHEILFFRMFSTEQVKNRGV